MTFSPQISPGIEISMFLTHFVSLLTLRALVSSLNCECPCAVVKLNVSLKIISKTCLYALAVHYLVLYFLSCLLRLLIPMSAPLPIRYSYFNYRNFSEHFNLI